jgi:hypothetical protein
MILFCVIIFTVNNKHKKVLSILLNKPILNNIKFNDNVFITLHKSHSDNEIKGYVVKQLQIFLNTIKAK